MAFGVSKRKLNLGTTNADAIFLLRFNFLTSPAYDDKRLSTAAIGSSSVVFMHTIGSSICLLANWLTSF